MYALLVAEETARYPMSLPELRRALPHVSFTNAPGAAELARFGVVEVQAGAQPAYDPDTQTLVEGMPILDGGQWREQWTVQDLTAEEVATRLIARRASLTCTPRRARIVLRRAGLLAAVEAWIATADEETQIEWEFATEIRRDWPALLACGAALGLTEEQLDGLFAQAPSL